ncbi:hypothetical protein [Proteus hauseri]|uniref:hypothetical protein n=1 Tax=Proteus hauseri TaxID=183417 RepID=UPI0032DA5B1F
MISKTNNNNLSSYVNNESKVTIELNEVRNRLSKIENIHFALFLPTESKSFIYKIVEKIKSILNVEKKIGFIKGSNLFKSSVFLTDDICEKKVKDLNKITISKKQFHNFIIDYNNNNKSNSFNWFVNQYVKTKGDLLLATKVAHFLEANGRGINPLSLISESTCVSNFLPLFNLIITETNKEIKKEIFFNIIDGYFNKSKDIFDSNKNVNKLDFLLESNYIIEWSDKLKDAFKNIMKNMIDKNIDLNYFLKGVISFDLIDIKKCFNDFGTAEHYVEVLNKIINKHISDYPNQKVCRNNISYMINSEKNIDNFICQYLNKIEGDLYIGIDKEQYLVRTGQVLDVFRNFIELSEK